MKYSAKIAMNRRGALRRLFRDMPTEDVALVLWEQTDEWMETLEDEIIKIFDENGPQNDDHLNWHGQVIKMRNEEIN